MNDLRIPEIGEYVRNLGTLVDIENIPPTPTPPKRDYIFEEIEARSELRIGDEVLKVLETLHDYYGLGTSVDSAIKGAVAYANSHNISLESDLEVVVIKIVRRYRARPLNSSDGHLFARDIYQFKPLAIGAYYNVGDPVETIVWSSKSNVDDNQTGVEP